MLRERIKAEVNRRKEHKAIKYWSEDERPREMLVKHGAENLSPAKLLAIIELETAMTELVRKS